MELAPSRNVASLQQPPKYIQAKLPEFLVNQSDSLLAAVRLAAAEGIDRKPILGLSLSNHIVDCFSRQ
jgi:hypothetical protein